MNFLLITSSGLPVYPTEGLPPGYKGEILPGHISGAEGDFGLIILQKKERRGHRGIYHYFRLLKKIIISHIFPPAFLQALFALNEDIIYHIEGHGTIRLRRGQYIMVPAPGKNLKAELLGDSAYKIFEAAWTQEAIKQMNGLFPELQKILYDKNGNWLPAAREVTGKIKAVIDEILNYPYDNKAVEQVYYEQQLERLLFLMIVQGNATDSKRLYGEKEAAYSMQEIILRNLKNPPGEKELAEKFQFSIYRVKKVFRKVFGLKPVSFTHRKRMEIAFDLV